MTKIVAILSGFQKPKDGWDYWNITDQQKLKFINFMIHDSPWKGCFLNSSAQDVLDKKAWVLNPKMGCNLLASAGFATRLISEWPQRFLAWDWITNLGFDAAEAFIFSMHVKRTKDGLIVGGEDYHIPFFFEYDQAYFYSFTGGRAVAPGNPYEDDMTYRNVSAVWGHAYGKKVGLHTFENIRPVTNAVIKNLDIFEPKKKGKSYVFKTDEEAVGLVQDTKCLIEKVA